VKMWQCQNQMCQLWICLNYQKDILHLNSWHLSLSSSIPPPSSLSLRPRLSLSFFLSPLLSPLPLSPPRRVLLMKKIQIKEKKERDERDERDEKETESYHKKDRKSSKSSKHDCILLASEEWVGNGKGKKEISLMVLILYFIFIIFLEQ
jgi:hypothetical protein